MASEELDAVYPYDLKINGKGYVLARQIEPNLPFRTQRAEYGYTPTFIQRSNVSGDFGDNQQDFWLTASQNDFSLGGGQQFFDPNDSEKSRKVYAALGVDVTTPGFAAQLGTPTSINGVSAGDVLTGAGASDTLFYSTTSAKLYEYTNGGSSTDRGAHGLSVQPTNFAFDGDQLYFSAAGAASVRKFNVSAHTFASFSASPAESMVYMNNTLYGIKLGVFYTYASTGAATASFTFKGAGGSTITGYTSKLDQLGGKVLVLRTGPGFSSLWQWDGTGMSILAEFPNNFLATDMCVVDGIVFISGFETTGSTSNSTNVINRTAVWFYNNGSIGRTYTGDYSTTIYTAGAGIAAYGDGFVFVDPCTMGLTDSPAGGTIDGAIMFYDLSLGAAQALTTVNLSGSLSTGVIGGASRTVRIAANQNGWMAMMDATDTMSERGLMNTTYPLPSSGNYLILSQFDFSSSLTKYMRGVTVNFTYPRSAVNPGTVDIYYRLEGPQGSWTLLQAAATSGTEYTFGSSITGHNIQIALKLNRGTRVIAGPSTIYYPVTVTRVYVRAAPVEAQYRTGQYILDMSGRDGKTPTMLRNGQPNPLTGPEQLTQLLADVTSTTPMTIIDRLGTYTGVALLENFEVIELKPEEYWISLQTRGV